MNTKQFAIGLIVATLLATSVKAQVLPPDFTLFGKTSGEYTAEWYKYIYSLSTNGDYLFPDASPRDDERVYFLQRTLSYEPTRGIQTYFVPDDAYLFFPIISWEWDNVETWPPLTVEQLREILHAQVDLIIAVQAMVDGVPLTNMLAYRTESPVFSVFMPTTDNFESVILGRPFEGLIDPMIAEGYLIMLKPLPPGLHDIRTGFTIGEPDGYSRERHYQINSLTIPEFVEYKTAQLADQVTDSLGAAHPEQPLLATLGAAQRSLHSGNLRAAISQLGAFQHIVAAKIGTTDPLLADQFTQAAQKIINKATTQLK